MSVGPAVARLDAERPERMADVLPQRLTVVSPLLGRHDQQALPPVGGRARSPARCGWGSTKGPLERMPNVTPGLIAADSPALR